MKSVKIEKGTQIGLLYRDHYTARDGKKKTKYTGYILLGIFSGKGVGLEINVYKVDRERLPEWVSSEMYYIKSGKKNIGYFVKQERKSDSGKTYHFLKGKVEIGGLKIKIHAYPQWQNTDDKDKPAYRIELMQPLECGVVKLA